jgi:multidrug efflux system membrane fusion protein
LRLVDPGNTVFSGTGSTLVVLTELQPITVVFNVSEDDLPQIQAQLKAGKTLEVDAYDRADLKEIAKGKLSSLDNQIDTTTGTLKFRATFANGNLALFPNQFVNARLLVTTLKSAVLVPSAAVQQNGTQSFLYLVKPDAKNAKNVIVSVQNISVLTSNEKVNAVQGVGSGVTIATSGFDRLENGAHAVVQQTAPAAPAASGTDNGVGASKGPPTPAANANSTGGNKTP